MSTDTVLVPTADVSALREELGGLPRNVRVIGSKPIGAWCDALLLIRAGAASVGHEALRDILARSTRFALFRHGGKSLELRAEFAQGLTLLAAETAVAPYFVPDRQSLRRLVFARTSGSAEKLIASVSIEGSDIIAWSCEPRPYRVALSDIPALAHMTKQAALHFEVSETGSRVHWPDGDVDLSLDSFRVRADPAFRESRRRELRAELRRYSGAIRHLRKKHGLKQSQVAGLSEREVRRLETGEHIPQYASLEKLAAAHGMGLEDYLRQLAKHGVLHDG